MSENSNSVSKGARIAGWIISILPVILLLFSATFKFLQPGEEFKKGLEQMGWTADTMFKLGFVEIGCAVLYLFPRTSVIGAILLTGYLGGAVATHVRIGDPSFVTAVILGILIWLGLWLRDPRLKAVLPFS